MYSHMTYVPQSVGREGEEEGGGEGRGGREVGGTPCHGGVVSLQVASCEGGGALKQHNSKKKAKTKAYKKKENGQEVCTAHQPQEN